MGRGDRRLNVRHLTGQIAGAALASLLLTGAALAEVCRADSVSLRGDWGKARFSVEVADDTAERAKGLMHRRSLPLSAGMLFIYETPQPLSFWMRNTLIPLDLLFIDDRGVVQKIHHSAIPLDETPIPGGDDLLSVLEINGGLAKRLGITGGSEIRHPAFAGNTPAWPC
ncbi:DUF192 domain-containing protein [Sulfitobacter sp. W002]|uniref:DUF192 domain-containing protein n=1 Tax=Sulfitobacter sp. W002 TaxID=2867024 RepID=UPI0021A8D62A|nr:DUF192 domain-containing protein [Sulfitobacter sp. W002]UWR28476.1 DUF192 domain-containing protein [Sulfitobacter sp. W002]